MTYANILVEIARREVSNSRIFYMNSLWLEAISCVLAGVVENRGTETSASAVPFPLRRILLGSYIFLVSRQCLMFHNSRGE